MVQGKLPVRGVLLIWIIVGQGPTALAVGAGGDGLDIFSLIYHFSFLSPSLSEQPKSGAIGFFLGTQEPVRNSRGKRAIGVRAIEVLLYILQC